MYMGVFFNGSDIKDLNLVDMTKSLSYATYFDVTCKAYFSLG